MLIPHRYWLVAAFTWTTLCLLGACATEQRTTLDQHQREALSGRSTADIVTAARSEPMPPMSVTTKDGTKIEIPAQQETRTAAKAESFEDFNSEASGSWLSSVTIPLGTKLILLAVGLLLLLLVAWLIRRSSKAADAAWTTLDGQLQGAIYRIGEQMKSTTDPTLLSTLRTTEADLLRRQAEALRA